MKKRISPQNGRPLVGLAVDGASAYGRAVMRGAMQYIQVQRRWEIFSVLRGTFDVPPIPWPKCDGAVIAGVHGELFTRIREQSRFPISCSGASPASHPYVICMDDVAAGAMAAEHLMECRLQSFAYYGVVEKDPPIHSIKRHRGFAEALAAKGYTCAVSPVTYHRDTLTKRVVQEHWPTLIEWLRGLPKPVGIFATDDAFAHDLAAACQHADFGVPEHVAIIGVNNDDLLCVSAATPLSSVDPDFSRMGYGAARMLDRLLQGDKLSEEERHIRLPPLRVVRRQSTDVLAVDDPDVADALRYIREHACDPCTIHDVLRRVPTSRRRLERLFERKLGYSPATEIIRVQVEIAKQLLSQPEIKLQELSRRCGYADQASFTRAFTRVVGVPPGAYRRSVAPPK
jgi:LacI family transcriptional regulator